MSVVFVHLPPPSPTPNKPLLPHHHLLPTSIPPPSPTPKKPPFLSTPPPLLQTVASSNNRATVRSKDPGLEFREKLRFLSQQLGLDPFHALSINPDLRSLPIHRLRRLRSLLSSFGLRLPRDASRILLMYPHLLTSDPLLLLPVLHFLHRRVPLPCPSDLRLAVVRCPRLLVSSVDLQLLPALHFLRRIGLRLTPHTTLLLVSSVEGTLIPKLHYIQSLGFSHREAVHMVIRSPGLFTFSIDHNFRPKVDFLMGEMGRDTRELFDFPQYFSFSLEGRIKPRYRMLLAQGQHRMSLAKMLRPSDGELRDLLMDIQLESVDDFQGIEKLEAGRGL